MIMSKAIAGDQTFLPVDHRKVVRIKPVVLTIFGNVFLII